MKFEIKSRWDGSVLFSIETESWRLAVEAALKARANLRYADLRSANLRYADLRYANLSYANLRSADLSSADLSYADLRSADLSSADLSYADLSSADLSSADLRSADLSSADLSSADLSSADLSSADLSYAKNLSPFLCTPLLMLLDQPGKIRAYKLVNADGEGPYNGGIKYEMDGEYSEKKANTDPNKHCGAGINLATLDWCMKEWREGYKILIAEFTAKDIAAIPTGTDGKFRCKKVKIVGEVDLKKIGLVKEAEKVRP
ncbi:pentapeptide repeat-containing protein [Candidatus Manganitrophus noduliformans]|uniref:Pentapeptide repeat-containing protein n=1 Tax=Candidatus Manganitrophus noduliformans TaxID=2606439 RepID=A0A7X6DMD3_9BACT|nr:pentapeptide repeat-containing protein [Candidatus Manganitrophus noduliformans]NKE69840.1 pentapeptide repeat-containing protein [Candidatus Manganitrophus noduliformans]